MPNLLMARHGETELKSSIRFWGSTDVPLSELGIEQAEKLSSRLAGERIDTIYASSLKRARVTAETIARVHGAGVVICPEIREVDFGKLEGLTFDEICKQYPEIARRWRERSYDFEYPGGEPQKIFFQRVLGFLDRLDSHESNKNILVVAHSGVLRLLLCEMLGLALTARWKLRLDLASLSKIEITPNGKILTLLNDVSHLG